MRVTKVLTGIAFMVPPVGIGKPQIIGIIAMGVMCLVKTCLIGNVRHALETSEKHCEN